MTLRWVPQQGCVSYVRRSDGVSLGLIVSEEIGCESSWLALAVETGAKSFEGVLDDHTHQALGKFPTLAEAQARCEEYAKWWRRSGAISQRCECTETPAP